LLAKGDVSPFLRDRVNQIEDIQMKHYYNLLEEVLNKGNRRGDRTGTGTTSLFGQQMRFDISKSFPLLTGKQTSFKMIATELLFFLGGHTNEKWLSERDCNIWKEWADDNGDLGPIYGKQWRSWWDGESEHDQIQNIINSLKSNPLSRRHIVSAWNLHDIPDESKSPQDNVRDGFMALPPCHVLFQFYTRELRYRERLSIAKSRYDCGSIVEWDIKFNTTNFDANAIPKYALSCRLDQRSADLFLGAPYNIASYSLLTYMIAQLTNMVPEEFIWQGGDCHIYNNHVDQVKALLGRSENKELPPLPTLKLNEKIDSIDDFELKDFEIIEYESLSAIKAPIAV